MTKTTLLTDGTRHILRTGDTMLLESKKEKKVRPKTPEVIRKQLIENGVRNLKEFGYPNANAENILSDRVLSAFFLSMLKENLGLMSSDVDKQIHALLKEIRRKKQ